MIIPIRREFQWQHPMLGKAYTHHSSNSSATYVLCSSDCEDARFWVVKCRYKASVAARCPPTPLFCDWLPRNATTPPCFCLTSGCTRPPTRLSRGFNISSNSLVFGSLTNTIARMWSRQKLRHTRHIPLRALETKSPIEKNQTTPKSRRMRKTHMRRRKEEQERKRTKEEEEGGGGSENENRWTKTSTLDLEIRRFRPCVNSNEQLDNEYNYAPDNSIRDSSTQKKKQKLKVGKLTLMNNHALERRGVGPGKWSNRTAKNIFLATSFFEASNTFNGFRPTLPLASYLDSSCALAPLPLPPPTALAAGAGHLLIATRLVLGEQNANPGAKTKCNAKSATHAKVRASVGHTTITACPRSLACGRTGTLGFELTVEMLPGRPVTSRVQSACFLVGITNTGMRGIKSHSVEHHGVRALDETLTTVRNEKKAE
ncbi:unnamed protein product [Trichogramma brassicae]|uniref:Uncharacterized protein n=1 Tax=Trichogramma brassicae TaxID=86971 RepID=A0A6H5J7W0_9HYME|nr:unnamed protein product [Trichogramma brassicae]